MREPKKKRKRTFGDFIRFVIMLAALGVFVYSGAQLLMIYQDYKVGTDEYKELESAATFEEGSWEQVESVETNAEGEKEMESPVDFAALMEINEDVIGWLKVDAMDISYPMVKGKDNDYYLHRTFKKVDNFAGSIFLEYQNSKKFTDQNTIVYGHNMKNGSMFGSLKKFREEGTFDKSNYFWIYTPDEIYKYEIFSCREVSATGEAYQISFAKDEDMTKYIETAVKQSETPLKSEVTAKDKLVTLSTCTADSSTRFIVQGKLAETFKVKK